MIKALPMMHIFSKPNFNFLNKKYICFAFSVGLLVWGMVNLVAKKDSVYGIDFAGGQIQEFKFDKPVSADNLRDIFKEAKMEHVVIQTFANAPANIILRTPETSEDIHEQVLALFKQKMPDEPFPGVKGGKGGAGRRTSPAHQGRFGHCVGACSVCLFMWGYVSSIMISRPRLLSLFSMMF